MTEIKMPAARRRLLTPRYAASRLGAPLVALAIAGGLAAPARAQPATAQPTLEVIELVAGMHLIRAEVAQFPAERARGLMGRRTMAVNEGMLFVFEAPATQCFWMRNTLLPLSIAFVADDGVVVDVTDMKPLDETQHCSSKPVRYALEMNQGWFGKRGIKPGFKLSGAPFRATR